MWPFPLVNISRSSQHFPFKRCNTPGLAVFSAFFFVSIPIFVAKIHLGSSESRVPPKILWFITMVHVNWLFELHPSLSDTFKHDIIIYHIYIYISPFYHHYIRNISIISQCYHIEFRLNPPLFSLFLLLKKNKTQPLITVISSQNWPCKSPTTWRVAAAGTFKCPKRVITGEKIYSCICIYIYMMNTYIYIYIYIYMLNIYIYMVNI